MTFVTGISTQGRRQVGVTLGDLRGKALSPGEQAQRWATQRARCNEVAGRWRCYRSVDPEGPVHTTVDDLVIALSAFTDDLVAVRPRRLAAPAHQ